MFTTMPETEFIIFLKTVFCYEAQAGLELSCLNLPSSGITDMYHLALQNLNFLF
jgi:hypothetical protein